MTKVTVTIDGRELPCYRTAGALLRFNTAMGKDATQMDDRSFTELATLLWCCCASACNREGVPFDYSLTDFADRLDMDALTDWSNAVAQELRGVDEAVDEGAKKKVSPQP